MKNVFLATDFGAVGDGQTDCTQAIQAALDQAGTVRGEVVIPPGVYLCGRLFMRSSVTMRGTRGWGYRDQGGTVLKLNNPDVSCLLDMTDAHSSMVKGIQFIGNESGTAHGIMVKWEQYNGNGAKFFDGYTTDFHEDSIVVDDCQVTQFGGNGIHLDHIFVFTIRNCQMVLNRGNGVYIDGWDGWIHDCSFSFNEGWGILGGNVSASVTAVTNRVEWNRTGGYCLGGGGHWIITGTCFDRNMGPGIKLRENANSAGVFVISSNIFHRNGKPRRKEFTDPYDNCHLYLCDSKNITVTNNAFMVGRDDGDGGVFSPDYGVVYRNLWGSVIKDNVMMKGAIKQALTDLGGHSDLIVKDNAGAGIC